MSDFSVLRTKIRYIIKDVSESTLDLFFYSASSVFTLTENNVSDITEITVNDGAALSSGDYTFYPSTSKVDVQVSGLVSGDKIAITYDKTKYSDSELDTFIRSALIQLSINNLKTFQESDNMLYPEPVERELNLIATVASVLVEGTMSSIRLPDLTIQFNEKQSPSEKIKNIIKIYKKDTHGSFGVLGA